MISETFYRAKSRIFGTQQQSLLSTAEEKSLVP